MLPPEVKEQLVAAWLLGGAPATAQLLAEELRARGLDKVADDASHNRVHYYVDFGRGCPLIWIDYYEVAPGHVRVQFYAGCEAPSMYANVAF